jgi:hypothetical protein
MMKPPKLKPSCSARPARRHPAAAADGIHRARAADHRHAGLAQRDDDGPGQPAAAAAATIPRQDRAQRRAIDAVLARARGAAQGRAEHPADHDRRYRLRRVQHVRRRHPDAEPRSDCQQRAALHQLQLDSAVLADARGADHGTKPSFDGLWGRCRAVNWISRVQQHHDPG